MLKKILTLLNVELPKVGIDLNEVFKGREAKKRDFLYKVAEASANVSMQQIELLKADIKSGSRFQSWWRPAVGWVCVSALAYNFVIERFLYALIVSFGGSFELPVIETTHLISLLIGMLGLSGLRSYEKIQKNVY